MSFSIQSARVADYASILALNESALPHVNSIGVPELTALAEQAFTFDLVWSGQSLAGFILVLREGADYLSPNYRWFSSRYAQFVYVDRIVVSTDFNRHGIGRALYSRLEKLAFEVAPLIACEVNLRPANPGSLTFHRRLGFSEVGQQETGNGEKRVSMMVKILD